MEESRDFKSKIYDIEKIILIIENNENQYDYFSFELDIITE
jgi:hypothetical protein